jgi:cysteine-rich repeat protein
VQANVEQCDDGNMSNTDSCVGNCVPADCGDGFVQANVEQCDDGNMSNTDACVGACVAAACGDGFVQANVEQCDDGNMSNTDACVGACVPAVCGDGFVYANVEQCDGGGWCNNQCVAFFYADNFESNNLLTLPWQTSGNALWATNNTAPQQGSFSAASGNLGSSNSVTSTLQVTLNLPAAGIVRFWYKVGSESGWDYLRFYIDNVEQGGWSGNVAWAQTQYNVGAGNHTFRWTYSKDSSVTVPPDRAWIDQVYVGP